MLVDSLVVNNRSSITLKVCKHVGCARGWGADGKEGGRGREGAKREGEGGSGRGGGGGVAEREEGGPFCLSEFRK